MTKTFHEIIAERDEEYNYTVRSTADIHKGELLERIRFAFLPYRLKSVEAETYVPLAKDNKWFPAEPNSATYSVKVITGLPIPKEAFIQNLAMTLHVHQAHLIIDGEDDIETDLINEPETIDKDYSQGLVGTRRIGEFVRELQSARKDRMKHTITREVYECYFTNHRGLQSLIKQPVRNGYYNVQRLKEGRQNVLEVQGPYMNRADGVEYLDRVRATNAREITEETESGLTTFRMLVDALDDSQIPGERMFEVGVHDLESGRRFTTQVSAPSPDLARKLAIKQVAQEQRLDPTSLSALAPKAK